MSDNKLINIGLIILLCFTILVIGFGEYRWKAEARRIEQSIPYDDDRDTNEIPGESPGVDDDTDVDDNDVVDNDNGNDGENDSHQGGVVEEPKTIAEQSGIRSVNSTMYTTTGLNIRTDASTSSGIIGTFTAHATVRVTGMVNNGWVRVNFNGQVGYVHGNYLTSTEPSNNRNQNTQPSEPSEDETDDSTDAPADDSGSENGNVNDDTQDENSEAGDTN